MKQEIKCKEQSTKSTELSEMSIKQGAKGKKLYALCSMLYALCFMIIIAGCATTGVEQQPSQIEKPNVLTGIDLQDYTVTVTADKPFTYTIYRSRDPYRIFVELLDVNIGAFNSKITSNKAGITEVIPSQVESPTFLAKLEMLLQTPSEVESEYKNNILVIKIKKEETTEKKGLSAEESPKVAAKEEPIKEQVLETKNPGPAVSEEKPPLPASNGPKATEITDISFEKSDGILKVVVKGNGTITPNVFPLDNRIVIDVPDVRMKAKIPSTVVSPLKG
ncbi:MAG: hypothetical protein OEW69_08790, partial [Nitrospirota bacterium]|nr:hypothetical protein [Nitrospirota bacterium]